MNKNNKYKNKLERRRLYYKLRKEYSDWEYFRIVHVDTKLPLDTYYVILSDNFATDINIELYYDDKPIMNGWRTDYSGCTICKDSAYSLADDMLNRLYNQLMNNGVINEYHDCDSGISEGIRYKY